MKRSVIPAAPSAGRDLFEKRSIVSFRPKGEILSYPLSYGFFVAMLLEMTIFKALRN
jgi:hypothetical protein